jgi:hypothetical protein
MVRVLKDWNPDGKAQKLARRHPQAHAQEESQKLETEARLLKRLIRVFFLCRKIKHRPINGAVLDITGAA